MEGLLERGGLELIVADALVNQGLADLYYDFDWVAEHIGRGSETDQEIQEAIDWLIENEYVAPATNDDHEPDHSRFNVPIENVSEVRAVLRLYRLSNGDGETFKLGNKTYKLVEVESE